MLNDVIQKCPLFEGVSEQELESIMGCMSATTRKFRADSFVFNAGDQPQKVGIVLSGSVHIVQEDYWGNRTILARVGKGGLFGEAFSCAEMDSLPAGVMVAEDAEIMLIDYRRIVGVCPSACKHHVQLLTNMMKILARKNLMLARKVGVISKRTTREKLLALLSEYTDEKGYAELPFSRQQLADYLCVERSALSREISAMKRDGVLDYDKNVFRLLKND